MRRSLPLFLVLGGCVTFDGQLFRGVHCTEVTEATCQDKGEWDTVCAACDEAYALDVDYPWHETFLDEGESIRVPDTGLVERFTVPTEDGAGELDAIWMSAHGDDDALAQVTVVYNHGNYASMEHYMPRMRILHELGVSVLAWDYRGYGKTTPNADPTAEQWWSDSELIYDAAAARAPDPDKMVVYAVSLGGLPAVEMALRKDPCALVLEAPFTSMQQITSATSGAAMPGSILTSGEWENYDKIADWSGPLLSMVGTLDTTFPPEEVLALHEAAGSTVEDYWEIPDVAHGVTPPGVPDVGLTPYAQRIDSFLGDAGCR